MTLIELIEQSAAQLKTAGVAFGHGTTNAFDEAAWLVLWRLGLPLRSALTGSKSVANRTISAVEYGHVATLVKTRVETRKPAAYLTQEAWLQNVQFYVDERAIVPRSFIAELLVDAAIDPWLSEQTHRRFRLPTEAEWEYAARAGGRSRYAWGETIGRNNANCAGCGSAWDNRSTAPVGSFAPNRFGLYDMHGNVWEWVLDCYNDSYVDAPADGGVWTKGDCSKRVLRGGAWDSPPAKVRAANRDGLASTFRFKDNGFRLAEDP